MGVGGAGRKRRGRGWNRGQEKVEGGGGGGRCEVRSGVLVENCCWSGWGKGEIVVYAWNVDGKYRNWENNV